MAVQAVCQKEGWVGVWGADVWLWGGFSSSVWAELAALGRVW